MPSDSPSRPAFDPERVKAARERLAHGGVSISEWARRNGYKPGLVRNVIAGRKFGYYGKSHDIAIKLGLKDGELLDPANG